MRCKRCGACCSDILPLSPEEIAELQDYVGKHPRLLRKKPINPTRCLFLRRGLIGHRCAVYKVRPAICRVYYCKIPLAELQRTCREQGIIRAPRSMYATIYGQ